MRLKLNEAQLSSLNAFVDQCPDCERLSQREVVLDLYDNERPISMNFVFLKDGIGIDGAAYLEYSEADSGYYMGERIEDVAQLRAALEEAGALSAQ